jgi:RNA polymerase sigma-70 factor (ECF subfamily)
MGPVIKGQSVEQIETEVAAESELNRLAKLCLGGASGPMRDLLHAIAPLVRSVCRGAMGRDNPELEDAIQESLVDAVRALPRFRFESDLSHYVARIALRKAVAVRQRERARRGPVVDVDPRQVAVASFGDAMEMRAQLVRNLLDDLKKEQATALRMRLILGHSIEEIARATGVSVNTVKTRLRLGKDQLRRRLERNGEAPNARR